MITNLLATIIISVTTNVIGVTEYWNETYTYPPSQGHWSENPPFCIVQWDGVVAKPTMRTSPDKQYIEVRRTRTLVFDFEGKRHSIELENTLLKKTERRRKVETKETWEEQEVPIVPEILNSTNYIFQHIMSAASITNAIDIQDLLIKLEE